MRTKKLNTTSLAFVLIFAGQSVFATLADLIPTNIGNSPNPATVGGNVTVSYRVTNQGGTAAPASHTKVQIKNASNVILTQQTFTTATVSANSFVSESRSMSLVGATAGTYYSYVIVDNNSEVTQSNTGNDLSSGVSFTVNASVTPADLLPQSISISPDPATAGGNVTVSYTVANQGGTAAPASHTKVQIKNASNVLLTEQTFSTVSISANSSTSENRSMSLAGASAGSYYAYVIVDNNSEVTQSNTGNDLSSGVSFTVNAVVTPADLLPQSISISPDPATVGGNVTVSYTVANQGGTAAPASHTKVQIKNASNVLLTEQTFSTVSISANSSTSENRSMSLTGASAGTYYAYVIVDNNSEVTQSNTGNDLSSGVAFTVNAAATPADLLPQNISVSPDPATAGGNVTVSYTVANQGGTAAPASHTKVQIKNASNVLLTEQTFSTVGISANSSANESRSMSLVGAGAGTYYAYVIVDNNSEVTQSNTGSDLSSGVSFTVNAVTIALCDIVVQGSTTISPNQVMVGSSITVSYTIINQGNSDAGASQTKIQVKDASNIQLVAPTFSTAGISAGSSINESRTIVIPNGTPAGTYRAYVILDNASQLTQSSSANDYTPGVSFVVQNTAVTKPDLAFQTQPSVSPNSLQAGDNTTVSFVVVNQGTASAAASKTKVWIKNNAGQVVASMNIDTPSLTVGQTIPQQGTLQIPASASPGVYSAQVILDNAIPGLDQLNEINDYSDKVGITVASPNSPPLQTSFVEGIDFNGLEIALNWQTQASGKKFAYIKATESTYTLSQTATTTFNNNVQGAKNNSIAVGVYHFGTPLFSSSYYQPDYDHTDSAKDEADFFYNSANSEIGSGFLPPALDIEDQIVKFALGANGKYVAVEMVNLLTGDRYDPRTKPVTPIYPNRPAMNPAALAAWIQDWMTEVYNLSGTHPILYLDKGYAASLQPLLGTSVNLWIADTLNAEGNPNAEQWASWTIHQYQQDSTIDLDTLYGSLAEMITPSIQLGARGRLGMTSGGFGIEASGNNSETITVQQSTDCINWTDACDIQLLNGVGEFMDSTAGTTPKQFYRTKPKQ
jgi:GH25 family lysozyme M1 (1,4-beta-N-acetylmuramidase)